MLATKTVTQTADGPLCKCPAPAVQKTTMKEGPNKGRVFWTCSTRTCKFFEWDDTPKKVPATFGDTVRSAQTAVSTRSRNASKEPIDIQVVGYGDMMEDFGVPEPALQVTFPRTGTDDLVRSLTDIQGVTPLHVDTEQGVRIYRQQDYAAVSEVLKRHPQYDVMHPPTTVFNAVTTELHRQRPAMDWAGSDIPIALQKKLMPFQREGVEYAVRKGGRVLIGDEMGLGKTIQAISLLSYYRREWPALVVVPSSLKFVWYSAVLAELPYLNPDLVQVVATAKDQLRGMLVIMSYEIVTRTHEAVAKKNFRVICLDEAHSIKNDRSQRCKYMRPILCNTDRLILLSGTPALNRPIELYTQVEALIKQRNHIFCSKKEFGQRYCDLKPASFGPGYDWKGHANLQELQYMLRLTCMIRREKAKVLHELPEKWRTEVHVTITEKEMKLMDAALNKLKDRFRSLDDIALVDEAADGMGQTAGKTVLKKNQIVHLFCATSKAKQQPVCEYIEQSHAGEKVLIFAHHTDMLNAVEKCVVGLCKKHNSDPHRVATDGMWDHVRIDGSVNASSKKALADHFQTSKQCKFAVLSILACGVGLTFHSSSTVIFAELYWTPGQLVQAEDRVHRIGQKDQCTIKYILAQNTSDDLLWPLLNRKLAVLGATLNKRDEEDEVKETWTEDVRQFHRGGNSIVHESKSGTFFIDKNQKKQKGAKVAGPAAAKDALQQGTLAGWGVKRKPEAEQQPTPVAPLPVPPIPAPLPTPEARQPEPHGPVHPSSAPVRSAVSGPVPLTMARPSSAPVPYVPPTATAPVPFVPTTRQPTPFVPQASTNPTPFVPTNSQPASQSGPKPFIPNVQAAPTPSVPEACPVPISNSAAPQPFKSVYSSSAAQPFVPVQRPGAPRPFVQTQPANQNAPRPFVPAQAPQPFRPQSAPQQFVPSPTAAVPPRPVAAVPTATTPLASEPSPPTTPGTPVAAVSPAVLETSPQKRRRKFALLGRSSPQTPAAAAGHELQPPASRASVPTVVPQPAPVVPQRRVPAPSTPEPVRETVPPVSVPVTPAPSPSPLPVSSKQDTPSSQQGTPPGFNPYIDLLERTHAPAPNSGRSGNMMEKLKAVAFKRKRD